MNYFKAGIIAGIATLLAACDYSYRYPCHDMENWDKEFCKRPYCEIHQECPDHIIYGISGPIAVGESITNWSDYATDESVSENFICD